MELETLFRLYDTDDRIYNESWIFKVLQLSSQQRPIEQGNYRQPNFYFSLGNQYNRVKVEEEFNQIESVELIIMGVEDITRLEVAEGPLSLFLRETQGGDI